MFNTTLKHPGRKQGSEPGACTAFIKLVSRFYTVVLDLTLCPRQLELNFLFSVSHEF